MTPPRPILSLRTLPDHVLIALKLQRDVERFKAAREVERA